MKTGTKFTCAACDYVRESLDEQPKAEATATRMGWARREDDWLCPHCKTLDLPLCLESM